MVPYIAILLTLENIDRILEVLDKNHSDHYRSRLELVLERAFEHESHYVVPCLVIDNRNQKVVVDFQTFRDDYFHEKFRFNDPAIAIQFVNIYRRNH